jgi:CelD/BcsL family acetyltransferase involved in cellulose biosynthesis
MAERAAGSEGAMSDAAFEVETFSDIDALPAPLAAFFERAAAKSFFLGIPWYRAMLKTAGPDIDRPRVYTAFRGNRPVAALVARERMAAGKLKTHMLLAPSRSANSSLYAPLLDADEGAAGLTAIARAIARAEPPFHVLRFDCLDPASPEFAALAAAFRAQHMPAQRFFNFINFYEDVAGATFEQFLARRPLALRRAALRAMLRLEKTGRARLEVIGSGRDLEAALIDYALVEVQSAKEVEFYAACTPELMRAAARAGALRLAFLHIDGELAAAQIWLISGGHGTIWRHHSAEKFAPLAPGVALTFAMIRHVLGHEALREIDFGPGSEEWKLDWLGRFRERTGLIVFNPRTAKGLAAAARQFAARGASTLAPTLREALRRREE